MTSPGTPFFAGRGPAGDDPGTTAPSPPGGDGLEGRMLPDSYHGKAESWSEHLMRLDFAAVHDLRSATSTAASEDEIDRLLRLASVIVAHWRSHEQLSSAWAYLEDAVDDWRRSPVAMQHLLDNLEFNTETTGDPGLPSMQVRSIYHARELTGNGVWQPRANPGPRPASLTPDLPGRDRGLETSTAADLGGSHHNGAGIDGALNAALPADGTDHTSAADTSTDRSHDFAPPADAPPEVDL
ncbi:hypothetical protein IU451_25590 [Nocardia cyriacigeorgica]|uniref:hypothetical protein n=1 Tax=Nocardia cyriacigeorgica TaxID=135487 RepID=UPI00189611EE|nr:hypothetical protein [Nocardia cyriacigeorgica]MBF6325876.1 hypothetical protein [Nocardia cyriacigeorgica]